MNTPILSDPQVGWARKMKEDFESAMERLRLIELQEFTDLPAFQIPDDANDYDRIQDE